jgi:hypothetical protein
VVVDAAAVVVGAVAGVVGRLAFEAALGDELPHAAVTSSNASATKADETVAGVVRRIGAAYDAVRRAVLYAPYFERLAFHVS